MDGPSYVLKVVQKDSLTLYWVTLGVVYLTGTVPIEKYILEIR